jgi:chaperonin GroES
VTIKPLNGFVIVQSAPAESVSPGGIIIPDAAQKPSRRGIVLAAEPWIDQKGLAHEPEVKPGDIVLFPRFCGEGFVIQGMEDEIIIFRHEDLLAVIPAEHEAAA